MTNTQRTQESFFRRNIWLFFFLFFQIVFPLLWMHDASNDDTHQRILLNCIYFIASFICFSFLNGIYKNILLIFFFIITIIPNVIVLGFFEMNNSILKSTDFWVVFDTNPSEAEGFLSIVTTPIIVKTAIYISVSSTLLIFSLQKKCSSRISLTKHIMCISITLLWLGLSITGYFRTNVPSVEFYKSWARYKKEMRELSEFYANRKNATTEANCYLDNFPKTFVIVIGESATKNHYGIYGYKRNTTPNLDSIKDELLIYNNVVTPATQTLIAMRQILTFSNYEDPNAYKKDASIYGG